VLLIALSHALYVERIAVVFGFFKRRRLEQAAYGLYGTLVGQARQPEFYTEYGVADTVDGRFDMIALHAVLVIRRIQTAGADGPKQSQALFDLMFGDMDRNLREMGVSDLAVGKHIKRMAKGYYGRAAVYEDGLKAGTEVLEEALRRNLYRKTEAADWQVAAVAAYAMRVADHLAPQDNAALLNGVITFPPVLPLAVNVEQTPGGTA
jgi:cytochrome b pre-mRNA-processing protein 3